MPATIGEAIQIERERREWSQKLLGQKAGVDKNTVNRAENNKRVMPKTLRKICKPLGIDANDFRAIGTIPALDKPQPSVQTSRAAAQFKPPQQASSSQRTQFTSDQMELAMVFLSRLDTDLLATLVRLSPEDQRLILHAYVDPLLMRRLQEAHGSQPPDSHDETPPKRK